MIISMLLPIFLAFFAFTSAQKESLSSISVLLPYDSNVKYELVANGCYKWRARAPFVEVHAIDECGSKVQIFYSPSQPKESRDKGRQSTWVEGHEEIAPYRRIRCEVFIDYIDHINIRTTTKQLYKDEIERLDIQAFDNQNNIFSTLEGAFVDWSIAKGASLLSLIPFSEQKSFTPNKILSEIEDSGRHSSSVLVKGIEGGEVTLNAETTDVGTQKIIPTSVNLSISFKPLELSHTQMTVTLGSSFVVGVSGGSLSVQSGGIDIFEATATADSKIYEIVPVGSSIDNSWRLYSIICRQLGTTDISVKAEKNAPRDKYATFKFSCEQPHSVYIYPVDYSDSALDIPSDCIGSMESTLERGPQFFNSSQDFKAPAATAVNFGVLAFSQDGTKFDNFSSLDITWRSGDNEKIAVIGGKSVNKFDVSLFPYSRCSYEQSVQFLDATGKASLTLTTKRSKVADLVSVFSFSIYRPLAFINPAFTVFLHSDNNFNLTLVHGSGHVQTSIDNNAILALQTRHEGENHVKTYHPNVEGRSTVTAKDLCSPKKLIEAKVRVSRVMKIKVDSPEMVEVNKFLEMNVIALDSHEEAFSPDQSKFISFETQMDNVRSLSLFDAKRYQFKGISTGICTVTFTTKNSNGGIVSSPPIHVHVFDPLTLMPRQLFLLPGARIQLQYYGGPRIRSDIIFKGQNVNGIFSLDQETGMLHALKTGTGASAVITATKDGHSIGIDQISVRVGHIQGISIYSKTDLIFQNESVVLEVRGNNQDEEIPFSWFGLGFQFEWKVADPRIISLMPLYSGATLEDERLFGVRAFAGSLAGSTTVTVKVTKCPAETNLLGKSAQFNLRSVKPEKLYSQTAVVIAPNSALLLGQPSYFESGFSDALQYELLKDNTDPFISVSNKGLISSSSRESSSFVKISEASEPPQSAVVHVLVKRPATISVLPLSLNGTSNILVGSTHQFEVVLRDKYGSILNSYDGVLIGYQLNVRDVVVVRTDTTHSKLVTALRGYEFFKNDETQQVFKLDSKEGKLVFTIFGFTAGEAILQVYIKNAETARIECETYFPLNVVDSIFPNEVDVNVGAVVAFSMAFPSLGTYKNHWSASNESTLSIDINGVAETHRPGRAVVHYNTSIRTKATVNVLPISRIESLAETLDASNYQFNVSMPLAFYGRRDNREVLLFNRDGVDQRIKYECGLKDEIEPQGFKVDFGSLENGRGCYFNLIPLIEYEDAVESLVNKNRRITTEIRAGSVVYHKDLDMAPLFAFTPKKLVFTENGPETLQLQLNWRLTPGSSSSLNSPLPTKQLFLIEKNEKQSSSSVYDYTVSLHRTTCGPLPAFNEKILFRSELTGQSMFVDVSYHVVNNTIVKEEQQSGPLIWIAAFLGIIAFVFIFLERNKRKEIVVTSPQSNFPISPMNSPSSQFLKTNQMFTPSSPSGPAISPFRPNNMAQTTRPGGLFPPQQQNNFPASPFSPSIKNRFATMNG